MGDWNSRLGLNCFLAVLPYIFLSPTTACRAFKNHSSPLHQALHVLRWQKVCMLAGWDGPTELEGRICFRSFQLYIVACMSCSFVAGWANLYSRLAVSLEVQRLQIDHQSKKYHAAVPLHSRSRIRKLWKGLIAILQYVYVLFLSNMSVCIWKIYSDIISIHVW